MKWAGMLVVSFRGVNFRFWSRLEGVLGKTPLYLAVKASFRAYTRRNINKLYIFNSFYLIDSCNQSLK